MRRFGDAEVNHLRHRPAVLNHDEDVRRLEVAMNDALLMRMLHAVADLHEQLQSARVESWCRSQYSVIGTPGHVLHHEVRPAVVGGAGIEDRRDVRVIHQRQGLAFGVEARDHLARVHAELDELERDAAPDRRRLLGEIDDAHSAFAERPRIR